MSLSVPSEATLATAHRGFEEFSQGLKTKDWQGFLDLLTEDFSFWFPVGQFQGTHVGKAKAAEFFQYVSSFFDQGLTLTLQRITAGENTVVFEVRSTGQVRGKPYQNQAAIAFDIRGQQICSYREYLGVLYQFGSA
jgi:ketosteroid isomerase-like protein